MPSHRMRPGMHHPGAPRVASRGAHEASAVVDGTLADQLPGRARRAHSRPPMADRCPTAGAGGGRAVRVRR